MVKKRWNRREYLAIVGTISSASVAGCLSDDGVERVDPIDMTEIPPGDYSNSINVWDWYVDARDIWVEGFQEEYNIDNVGTAAYSAPTEWYSRLEAGNDEIDIVSSTGQWTTRAIENDYAKPLPVELMSGWDNVPESIKQPLDEHFSKDDEVYAIPQSISIMPALTYNEDYFETPPDSWDILWDEEYADRMFMWDRPRYACQIGAYYTGQGTNEEEWDLEEIKEVLIQQKDLNVTYWTEFSSATQSFVNEEVIVGPLTDGRAHQARFQDGAPISYAIPEAGATYAMDVLMIPDGAPNPQTATMYLDYILRPENIQTMYTEMSYHPPLTADGFRDAVGDDASEEAVEFLIWDEEEDVELLDPIDDDLNEEIANTWEEVKAA